ncbi:MAG TPA: toll/interleukin-1 receptor domain-containing protein [Polyangiaceae bacterium]|nr:toll/interleukin-1 receptor domain-containing protein [Polyangiaceae bacterium]
MVTTPPPSNREDLRDRYAAGERAFAYANLGGADLSTLDLSEVDLSRANLRRATLRAANLLHADLSFSDVSFANLEWVTLERAKLDSADLNSAELRSANLRSSDLTRVDLAKADLTDASLEEATLIRANLSGATMRGVNLAGAQLQGADLSGADLSSAVLDSANLSEANLTSVTLKLASVSEVTLGHTALIDIDLSPLCRAKVVHAGESAVDFRSIVRSVKEPRLKEFLSRIGMPDVFVEYMIDCARSLDPHQVFSLFQSTFISYGGPDERFAQKLNDALESRGVTTFFFKDDAPPGEKLHRVMRRGVNEHDRVILICSEASLERPGLLNELEETMARESRDGGRTYLIPVRVDDYVISGWNPKNTDLAQAVRDRVIADFTEHSDPVKFRAEIAKLIAVLKKPSPAP